MWDLGQNETCTAPRWWEASPCLLPTGGTLSQAVVLCYPMCSTKQPYWISYDFRLEVRKPSLREIAQGHAFMAGKYSCTCPEILGSSLCAGEGGVPCEPPACPHWLPLQSPSPAGPGAGAPPTHYPTIGVCREPRPSAVGAGLKAAWGLMGLQA